MIYGVLNLGIAAEQDIPVIHIKGHLESRHLFRVHLGPTGCVGEQGDAVGMIDQAHHTLGGEIGKNGDDNGFIGVHGQIGKPPFGAVIGAEGNFISLLEAGFLKHDVETGDVRGHLGIGEGIAADGIEGGLVPVFARSLLQALQIVRIILYHTYMFNSRTYKFSNFSGNTLSLSL